MKLRGQLLAFVVGLSVSAQLSAQSSSPLDIPAGKLTTALEGLERQTKVELIYSAAELEGLDTRGIHGSYTIEKAIAELLAGTDLTVTAHPSGALLITRKPPRAPASHESEPASPSRDTVRQPESATTEIVVTATRRAEFITEVPGGVSVISGPQLEASGASELADYSGFLPGAVLQSFGHTGYNTIAIRGIAPQSVGSSTAIYVDEIPVGPASALTLGAFYTVDINPWDLERIEVLKGPQGTLYGASSLGGVIKYVTRPPDLTQSEVHLSQEVSYTDYGAAGVKFRGSVSVPLIEDTLAVRVGGSYRHDGGYIDDLGVGGPNTNRDNDREVRASLLYQPLTDLSIQFTAMEQDDRNHGNNVVDYDLATGRPLYGNFAQLRYVREPSETRFQLLSMELHYRFGGANLISATSWSSLRPDNVLDASALAGLQYLPPTPASLLEFHTVDPVTKWTQEFRLVSDRIGIVEWMLGAFIQHESLHNLSALLDPDSTAPNPNTGSMYRKGTLTERAAFADVTVFVSPTVDLTAGLRDSRIAQNRWRVATGVYNEPLDPTAVGISQQGFTQAADTYLATIRWHPSETVMIYGRAASGYRPGGGRAVPPDAPGNLPDYYTSDSLWSYESGVKLHTPHGRLTFDLDTFWIDWTKIQTLQPVGPFLIDGNAGTARSRGVEMQTQFIPAAGLEIGANAAFTDARFTQTVPLIGVYAGESLFYVPRWTTTATVDYSRPLWRHWRGHTAIDWQYQSGRLDENRTPLPAYAVWNARVGLDTERLRVTLYARNLTNKLALLGYGGAGNSLPYGFTVNTPRTIGLAISEDFR